MPKSPICRDSVTPTLKHRKRNQAETETSDYIFPVDVDLLMVTLLIVACYIQRILQFFHRRKFHPMY